MTPTPDDVLGRLRDDLGLRVSSLDPVDGGADRHARVWRASVDGAASLAVKLAPDGSAGGLLVAEHLAGSGVPGVPRPVAARDGRPWADLDGWRVSATPWVEGVRGCDLPRAAMPWTALGRLLRSVHDTTLPDGLAAHLPGETRSVPALTATVRELSGRLSPPTDEPGRAVAEAWRAASGSLAVVVAAAAGVDRLAAGRPTGLAHTDPHLGNVVVDRRGTPWLLDWDDVALAPRERDLVFARAGVPFFGPVDERERSAFERGYGTVPVDDALLAAHACVRALEDVTDWTGQALDVRLDRDDRAFATEVVQGLVEPDGLLTRAAALAAGR